MKSRHLLGKDVNGVYIILGLEARCRQDQMFSFIWRIAATKSLKEYLKAEEGKMENGGKEGREGEEEAIREQGFEQSCV